MIILDPGPAVNAARLVYSRASLRGDPVVYAPLSVRTKNLPGIPGYDQRLHHPLIASMPIDNCTHTFDELAATVLPAHLERLKTALQSPMPATTFVGFKSARRELLTKLGHSTDFPGCYVFIDVDRPVYVGISRGVVKRLVQHLNFESHFTASLVYKMASEDSARVKQVVASFMQPRAVYSRRSTPSQRLSHVRG